MSSAHPYDPNVVPSNTPEPIVVASIAASDINLGNIDVLSIAAGDNNIGNVDIASVAVPATFYHGQMVVTTAGTELVLAASQVLLTGVTIKALHANTGWIFIGKNPVTLSTGFVLDAGESIFICTDNLADIFVDSSVSGEGVSYLGS